MKRMNEYKGLKDHDERKSDHASLLRMARENLKEMDEVDGGLEGVPVDLFMKTVVSALDCAIHFYDWSAVAEARLMISDRIESGGKGKA